MKSSLNSRCIAGAVTRKNTSKAVAMKKGGEPPLLLPLALLALLYIYGVVRLAMRDSQAQPSFRLKGVCSGCKTATAKVDNIFDMRCSQIDLSSQDMDTACMTTQHTVQCINRKEF